MFFFFAASLANGEICTPFKVHLGTVLPRAPEIKTPATLPPDWELSISEKIGKVQTQNEFPKLYQTWLQRHPRDLTEQQRFQWLSCLLYYVSIDTDKDGIPDWSAINDHQPAKILFPQDPDQDGDGILNVLDAEPLNPTNKASRLASAEVPLHLKINYRKRPETSLLQQQLYKEFHILAIDHTDEHSPVVLRELLYLLRKGFTKNFVSSLHTIKYIYAFASHDPTRNIASYHLQAQALSVAGMSSYRKAQLNLQEKIDLLAALSHEIGHAVIFEKLSTEDLAQASYKFSGWKNIQNSDLKDSFFSKVFFEPFATIAGNNMVSQYAMSNRHEWFAESLAASVLNDLGQSGLLPKNWKSSLIKRASFDSGYWVDYTRISDDFRGWFRTLLKK